MKKILLVTNIPNAYRIPLFNELDAQLKNKGMLLKVVFAAEGYSRRLSKVDLADCRFEYKVLDSSTFVAGDVEKTMFSYKGLWKELRSEKPFAVIVSGFSAATVKTWLFSSIYKVPYIIWSGSILKKGRNDSPLRRFQRKLLAGKASAFVAYGTKAKEYLQSLGASPQRIAIGINTVDTDFFEKETSSKKGNHPNGIKHLIYIGYLNRRKNVAKILEAVALLARKRNDFRLDIVGDGESRDELEKLAADLSLEETVIFHGFRQKNELPAFLAQSYVFLFQTDFDIWGLTLVEAMAAGLPCLSSVNAGATCDLVENEKTGFIVDFDETSTVAERINWLLDHTAEAEAIGQRAKEYIREQVNLKISAEGFIRALGMIKNG